MSQKVVGNKKEFVVHSNIADFIDSQSQINVWIALVHRNRDEQVKIVGYFQIACFVPVEYKGITK